MFIAAGSVMLKTASADDTLNPTREDFGCRQPRVAGAGQTVILGAPQPRFRGHWLSQENGAAPPAAPAPAGCAHGVGPRLADAPFRRACLPRGLYRGVTLQASDSFYGFLKAILFLNNFFFIFRLQLTLSII